MSAKIKTLAIALAASTLMVGAANAAGFSRGNADTDIIYEEGNFNIRAGAVYVSPSRGYETINGAAATDPNFVENYAVPSAAIKLNITDNARCAGTYTQVYGGNTTYGPQKINADLLIMGGMPTSNATESVDLDVSEMALTCGYGVDLGKGRAWILGGVFLEKFNYTEDTIFGTLSFDGDHTPGYRIGAAYEIPEIALRAQLMYRSSVTHTPDGTYLGAVPGALAPGLYTTTGVGTTPQSVELKVQSGIAAGTLLFASVKWTDWSVIDTLDYVIAGVVPSQNEYYWEDAWTVSVGVGRQFTDNISGSLSLTWDQGVSTGYDMLTDTWTLGTGVRMKGEHGALSLGGGISYLTAGSQEAGKADFDATVGGDWSYAIGGNYVVNF